MPDPAVYSYVKRQIALIGLVLALSMVGFFGSRAASGGGGGCFEPVKTQPGTEIGMKDFCFDTTVALVEPGDTVTWTNHDAVSHNVGLVNTTWSSRDLGRNDTVSYRFEKPGVFPYVCFIHAGMSGAVVVEAPEVGAIRRGEVGTSMGYTKFKAGEGAQETSQVPEKASDKELASDDADPTASGKGGQAFYVFLVLVGALLMVAVIFLALNRKAGRGD